MAAAAWSLCIFYLSVMRVPQLKPIQIQYIDKVAHFFMYGILCFLLFFAVRNGKSLEIKKKIFIIVGTFLYGFCIEMVQYKFFPSRSFEISDIVANLTGVLSAVFIYRFLHSIEQKKQIV